MDRARGVAAFALFAWWSTALLQCSGSGNEGGSTTTDGSLGDTSEEAPVSSPSDSGGDAPAYVDGTVADTSSTDSSMTGDALDGSPGDTFVEDGGSDALGQGDGADGATVPFPDASNASDASDASPTSGPEGGAGGGATLCGACPSGTKACSGVCFPDNDPYFSCGTEAVCTIAAGGLGGPVGCNAQGQVTTVSCDPGLADCDGIGTNGCETDITTPQNCGSCGNACASGQVCSGGSCTSSCTFPLTNCSGSCVDLTGDALHCGSCGAKCGGETTFTQQAVCTNGKCAVACRPGFEAVGSKCVDPNKDSFECGPQHVACSMDGSVGLQPIPFCDQGTCQSECPMGFTMCSSACTYTGGDSSNCGACGVACGTGNVCAAGHCAALESLAIATGLQKPEDLVVDGTDVFFTTLGDNSVSHVSTTGGPVTVLATNQAQPERLTVDATYVYWSSYLGGAILRTLRAGAGSFEVLTPATNPWGLYVDSSYVYWADGQPLDAGSGQIPEVLRASKSNGGGVTGFQVTYRPWEVLVDGNVLYAGGNSLVTPNGPIGSGPASYGGDEPEAAIGGGYYYDIYSGDVLRVNMSTGAAIREDSLFFNNLGGGAANACGWFVGFSGQGLYLTPVTGFAASLFYSAAYDPIVPQAPLVTSTSPERVVISGGALYWTDASAGAIYKVALPQ